MGDDGKQLDPVVPCRECGRIRILCPECVCTDTGLPAEYQVVVTAGTVSVGEFCVLEGYGPPRLWCNENCRRCDGTGFLKTSPGMLGRERIPAPPAEKTHTPPARIRVGMLVRMVDPLNPRIERPGLPDATSYIRGRITAIWPDGRVDAVFGDPPMLINCLQADPTRFMFADEALAADDAATVDRNGVTAWPAGWAGRAMMGGSPSPPPESHDLWLSDEAADRILGSESAEPAEPAGRWLPAGEYPSEIGWYWTGREGMPGSMEPRFLGAAGPVVSGLQWWSEKLPYPPPLSP